MFLFVCWIPFIYFYQPFCSTFLKLNIDLRNRRRHDIITLNEGGGCMGDRLFDLDLTLIADYILLFLAIIIFAIIFIGIPILIINLIKMVRRKNNCENCPYKNVSEKAV